MEVFKDDVTRSEESCSLYSPPFPFSLSACFTQCFYFNSFFFPVDFEIYA